MKKCKLWHLPSVLWATLLVMLLSTCFNPLGGKGSGETLLSITFPGGSTNKAVWAASTLTFEVTGSGPSGQSFTVTGGGGETVTEPVVPGQWDIYLRAFDSSTPTTDEADSMTITIDVKAGITNNVAVPMRFKDMTFIGAYLSDVGPHENPVSLSLALHLDTAAWTAILGELATAGYDVALNLSACTITGTAFDPGTSVTNPAGKALVKSMVLPESATSIANGALLNATFNGYTGLDHVDIGINITDIGDYAFINCNLTSVIIPDSVTTIGYCAFEHNELTNVIIPDSVTTIDGYAFGYNSLTSVIIPDSVTTIGRGAFENNELTNVTIGDNVTFIGIGAFRDNKLSNVKIPDSVTTIERDVFANNNLTSITIPDSVHTITEGMFYGNNLTSFTIPTSIYAIDLEAFMENKLANLTIPDSVYFIGLGAFAKNELTSVIIPNSVIFIGFEAFANNKLSYVKISESVTTIEGNTFNYNNLTSVTIPASVTTIGSYAFFNNPLTSVTFEGLVTTINYAFPGSLHTIYSGPGTYNRSGTTWTKEP